MRKTLQKITSWLLILLFIGGNLNCFHAVFFMLVVCLVNRFLNCSYGHNLLFFILRTKVHFALSWFTACSAVCAKSWWPLDWSHASLILFKNAFKQQLLSKTINTVRIKKTGWNLNCPYYMPSTWTLSGADTDHCRFTKKQKYVVVVVQALGSSQGCSKTPLFSYPISNRFSIVGCASHIYIRFSSCICC